MAMSTTTTTTTTTTFLLLATLFTISSSTTLTLHNLCPYPIWPHVVPNDGYPSVAGDHFRLDASGAGLASFFLPNSPWAGRVVPRTGCSGAATNCESGTNLPFTIAQISVHAAGDHAGYSVSLVDGFNVPLVISPQAIGGGQCPVLGCTQDLNQGCPRTQQVLGRNGDIVACKGWASYFKKRCPYTRTTSTDVEPVPQSCVAPGELKIVFCASAMVGSGEADEAMVIRTVVADN